MDAPPCSRGAISTHAPAQGATLTVDMPDVTAQDFNPRSRTGSDPVRLKNPHTFPISTHAPAQGATGALISPMDFIGLFQPTLPHRERPILAYNDNVLRRYFNPRSRTGSDTKAIPPGGGRGISTHAPAQGATACQGRWCAPACISTHAPAQGATAPD